MKKIWIIILASVLLLFSGSVCTAGETDMDAQYRQTLKDLKFLRDAIQDYVEDHEKAPRAKSAAELLDYDVGNGLTFLQLYLEDIPKEKISLKDAWGNDFVYKYRRGRYYLAAPGSDGKLQNQRRIERKLLFKNRSRKKGKSHAEIDGGYGLIEHILVKNRPIGEFTGKEKKLDGEDIFFSNKTFLFAPLDEYGFLLLRLYINGIKNLFY